MYVEFNNEERITLKLKIRRRQRLGMSIQMSKIFATLLAHFFNRHGYHTYWQVYRVDVVKSVDVLS
jgi:hypothetical protein